MPLRTLQRPRFVCVLLMDWALTMKTLERQRLRSNAERWNDEKTDFGLYSFYYRSNAELGTIKMPSRAWEQDIFLFCYHSV